MDRAGKLYKDEMTVEGYRQRLKEQRKIYGQKAEARAINQRKARAMALGETALKIMDAVREASKGHSLIKGTLEYMLDEAVIYPTEDKDRKEFQYTVMYQVQADEPMYTEERIGELCADLERRLKVETDEMFPGNEETEETKKSE